MRIQNLVIHTNHRCCLECYGCNHLSPWHRGDAFMLQPEDLQNDLAQIQALKIRVGELHLLGGEPLLCPHLEECINVCKGFPAVLWLKTNGMLLGKQPDSFWQTLNGCNMRLQVTNYCLKAALVLQIRAKAKRFGVALRINKPGRWHMRFQTRDMSDGHVQQAFKDCDFAPYKYLQDGKLYRCSIDCYAKPYFEKLGLLWAEWGADIYAVDFEVQCRWLFGQPSSNCRICRTAKERKVGMPWRRITAPEIETGNNG